MAPNLVKWWPSPNQQPTQEDMALGLRLLFNAVNDHDQAITTLASQSTTSAGVATTNTKTVVSGGGTAGPAGPQGPAGPAGSGAPPGLGGLNNQTGNATYTTTTTDNGILLVFNRSGGTAVALNSAVATPYFFFATNLGTTGTATLTPSSGNINGGGSFALTPLKTSIVVFDGTNWTATVLPVVVDLQTNSVDNASQSKLNLIGGTNVTVTDGGAGNITIAATSSGPLLKTNSVNNASQTTLNLIQGTNVTITDGGSGNITIAASSTVTSAYTVRIKTANYTAVANDAIFCNTSGGGFTITLPAAASNSGVAILVKKTSTDANNITAAGAGGDLVDGAATQLLTLPYSAYTLVSDGVSNWWII